MTCKLGVKKFDLQIIKTNISNISNQINMINMYKETISQSSTICNRLHLICTCQS